MAASLVVEGGSWMVRRKALGEMGELEMTVQGVKSSLFNVKRGLDLRLWLMVMARVRASRVRR